MKDCTSERKEGRGKQKKKKKKKKREKIEQRNELVIISGGNKIRESNGKVASFSLIANELPTRERHTSSNLISSQTQCFSKPLQSLRDAGASLGVAENPAASVRVIDYARK